MYVYIQSEPRLWTVGFYKPDGKFEPESDHGSPGDAGVRVSYLNGGGGGVRQDVRQAIAAIVDYNWNDEERDYAECSDDQEIDANMRTGHIFESLTLVHNWLNGGH